MTLNQLSLTINKFGSICRPSPVALQSSQQKRATIWRSIQPCRCGGNFTQTCLSIKRRWLLVSEPEISWLTIARSKTYCFSTSLTSNKQLPSQNDNKGSTNS